MGTEKEFDWDNLPEGIRREEMTMEEYDRREKIGLDLWANDWAFLPKANEWRQIYVSLFTGLSDRTRAMCASLTREKRVAVIQSMLDAGTPLSQCNIIKANVEDDMGRIPSWLYCNLKSEKIVCERCGGEVPIPPLPIDVKGFTDFMAAEGDKHKDCKA